MYGHIKQNTLKKAKGRDKKILSTPEPPSRSINSTRDFCFSPCAGFIQDHKVAAKDVFQFRKFNSLSSYTIPLSPFHPACAEKSCFLCLFS